MSYAALLLAKISQFLEAAKWTLEAFLGHLLEWWLALFVQITSYDWDSLLIGSPPMSLLSSFVASSYFRKQSHTFSDCISLVSFNTNRF